MLSLTQKVTAALMATSLMLVTWLPLVSVPGSASLPTAARSI